MRADFPLSNIMGLLKCSHLRRPLYLLKTKHSLNKALYTQKQAFLVNRAVLKPLNNECAKTAV